MPNSPLRKKYEATLALWMMCLVGRHAMWGQDPPISFRSMTAARLPCFARVQAMNFPPSPLPSTKMSYLSDFEADVFRVYFVFKSCLVRKRGFPGRFQPRGFECEVAGIVSKTTFASGCVTAESLSTGRKKERIILPQTARVGGW